MAAQPIACTNLIEMLDLLVQEPRCGKLLVQDQRLGDVLSADLVYGIVVEVRSNGPACRLTGFLSHSGLLAETRVQSLDCFLSRTGVRSHLALGRSELVEASALSLERTHCATEALLGLSLLGPLSCSIDEDVESDEVEPQLELDIESLLDQCRSLESEAEQLRGRFCGGRVLVHKLGSPAEELSTAQLRVLRSLSEPREVGDLLIQFGLGRRLTLQAIDGLYQLGAVELQSCAEPEAPESVTPASEVPEAPVAAAYPDTKLSNAYIAIGRWLMENGDFQGGVEAFSFAMVTDPRHPVAPKLLEGAKQIYCSQLYRHELPPDKQLRVNAKTPPADAKPLSPEEAFLISRAKPDSDVRSVVAMSPMSELDALLALRRLMNDGYVLLV